MKKRIITGLIVLACIVGIGAVSQLQPQSPAASGGQEEKQEAPADEANGNAGQTGDETLGDADKEVAGAKDGVAGESSQAGNENDGAGSGAGNGSAGGSGSAGQNVGGGSGDSSGGGTGGSASGGGISSGSGGTDTSGGGSGGSSGQDASGGSSGGGSTGSQEDQKIRCTIEIRCDAVSGKGIFTANGHPELEQYAASPVILSVTQVTVEKGATVYDVLKKVCDENHIQIEPRYTAGYGTYYIEGINYLYEFSAGRGSGWKYRVNGSYPSLGCSGYRLSGGEQIVWDYVIQ